MQSQEQNGAPSSENIEEQVKASDPVSAKIIKCTAKYNALDECMSAIKKAYEKEVIGLSEFLSQIRSLSQKQAKQKQKMDKIQHYFTQAQGSEEFKGY